MGNHPNRSRGGSPSSNPQPAEIRAAREAAGLSQTSAALLVHTSCRAWQQWEAEYGTVGHRRMHPAFWELFRIKSSTPPQQGEAMEWQSIETAPKDGTRILLCRNELVEPVTIGFWSMVGCCWSSPLWAYKEPSPTHWMPLPKASNVEHDRRPQGISADGPVGPHHTGD